MKTNIITTSLLATALMLGATAAQAEKSRTDVQQELKQAKVEGTYSFGEQDYPKFKQADSTKTRAQVEAELAQAKAHGQYTFGEEDYPPKSNS